MKLVRIRQDLEKSRNLSYMVQRREQLKRRQINLEKEMSTTELEIANATPLPDPSTVVPQNLRRYWVTTNYGNCFSWIVCRKRGRPARKKAHESSQPAAKKRGINPEEEENKLEKQSVSISKQRISNHSSITKPLVNTTVKDENKKSTGIDCRVRVKEVSVPLKRYPLRRNGHILCESKPVLHCNNNVLLQKKQPLVVIKKCHELQRLYNVSFSCKGKMDQDAYYLRNGWKQEYLPR